MFEKSQYSQLHVDEQALHYKGKRYPLTAISHLEFANVLTTHSVNLVETGKTSSSSMKVSLSNGESIKVSFDEARIQNWFRSGVKDDIQNLNTLYQYLAQKTFAQRLNGYYEQVRTQGCFVYDECRFFLADKIVFRGKDFKVGSSSLMRGAGYVELRPKAWTILDKIKREASLTKIPQFSTSTDTDVIFYILKKNFGLSWSESYPSPNP